MKNVIGEFSNILINRAVGLTIEDMLHYRGFEMKVMGDICFFLNATRKGPAMGLSVPVGSFRRHDAQLSSSDFNPKFFILFGEWELFLRGEFSAGDLGQREALKGAVKLNVAYSRWLKRVPALEILIPGVEELLQQIRRNERDLVTDAFRADLDRFVAACESAAVPAA
jgi:hypothetical protein